MHTKYQFIFIENTSDQLTDNWYTTQEEIDKLLKERALEYFSENIKECIYSLCLINFDKKVSTIYEYNCIREIKIDCTVY